MVSQGMQLMKQRRMTLRRIETYRATYRHLLRQELRRRKTDVDAIRAARVRMKPNTTHLSGEEWQALLPALLLEESKARRYAHAVIV